MVTVFFLSCRRTPVSRHNYPLPLLPPHSLSEVALLFFLFICFAQPGDSLGCLAEDPPTLLITLWFVFALRTPLFVVLSNITFSSIVYCSSLNWQEQARKEQADNWGIGPDTLLVPVSSLDSFCLVLLRVFALNMKSHGPIGPLIDYATKCLNSIGNSVDNPLDMPPLHYVRG